MVNQYKKIYMKTKNIISILWVFVISLWILSCNDKDMDNTPAPAQVTDLSYVKTHGGAIISYKIPEDKHLSFVRAKYINSQNVEVSKVSSKFDYKIEVDGFVDLKPHTIKLYSVGLNGKESKAAQIEIVPDTSYIDLIKESLKLEPILGGVRATWFSPTDKTVFIYVDYSDGENEYQRILSSSHKDSVKTNIKGLDPIAYNFSITVEDFSHNKTQSLEKGTFTPMPEMKLSKANWKVLTALSANGTSSEGKTESFIDDVIDTRESGTDNSYFIIHRNNNGGALMFFNEFIVKNGNPLMMVVDMGKEVMISRIVCWQRAFDYSNRILDASDNNTGVSSTYAYYKDDNLKSFLFYATNKLSDITAQNVWDNSIMHCDFGGPFDDGFVPQSKIQEAINGHEFELSDMMGPYRYFVMGLTATYGSEIQACFSEISLYGIEVE